MHNHDAEIFLFMAIALVVIIVLSVLLKLAFDAKGDCEEDRHSGLDGVAGLERTDERGFEVITRSVSPPLRGGETPAKPGANGTESKVSN